MVTLSQSKWGLRAITLVVWGMAAASAAYWGLRLSAGGQLASIAPAASSAPAIDALALARILGVTASAQPVPQPAISMASRFALQGVVAGAPGGGAALISVDGKPAKPFRVGSAIEDGLVLKTATAREVTLAATRDGPTLVTLEMPLLK